MCRKNTQIIDYSILKQILFLKENIDEDKMKAKKNAKSKAKKNTNTCLNLLELKAISYKEPYRNSSKMITIDFKNKKIKSIKEENQLILSKACSQTNNNNINKRKKETLNEYIGKIHFFGNEKEGIEKDNISNNNNNNHQNLKKINEITKKENKNTFFKKY